MPQNNPKIYAIIGPTASGKSETAVKLAKKINGEIISADSRQVYKGLNIGAGKVPGKWQTRGSKKVFVYKSVPHHCIDFVSPKRQYTVADFKRDGARIVQDILARGKTPIICGGTGHYVDALLFDTSIPEVVPNLALRTDLEKKSAEILFKDLQKKDAARAATIDRYNKRRLIRALEIIYTTGKPVPKVSSKSKFNIKWTYLNPPREELYKKIEKRLDERLKKGMLREVKRLHANGVSWKRMEAFGLEYRYLSRYLRGLISLNEMCVQLLREIKQYAKRQQTWFKKYSR